MGTTTPLLGLYQPSSGETGYGANVDTNFATLDAPMGLYAVRGLLGNNNATTPTTKFDFSCDGVRLMNPTNKQGVTRTAVTTLTNDTGLAGPAANGRDQAGAFAASSWVHFYFIWNGTAVATISSANAPATGPTMPTGYTHWAYLSALRFNGSSQLLTSYVRGSWVYYATRQSILSAGGATVETAISLATVIPPNGLSVAIDALNFLSTGSGGTAATTLDLRVITGNTYTTVPVTVFGANGTAQNSTSIILPNIGQNLLYLFDAETNSANISARSGTLNALAYQIPNGGG